MNPIVRMMKRYIKMPLKYALPLLFISALVLVSISGCTSSTNPTATPTATSSVATNTASFDPILTKMMPTLKAEFPSANMSKDAKNAGQSNDILWMQVAYPKNGTGITATIANEGAGQAAAGVKTLSESDISSGGVNSPNLVTRFGLQAATAALGHAPSTVNDVYVKGTGNNAGIDNEYIQYDSLFVQVMYTTI